MPSASRDYGFEDDGQACDLLRAEGFIQTRDYDHYHPEGKKPSQRAIDALNYLFEEWDYGTLIEKPAVSS